MDFPKKQQQCLIPKYLLDYLGEVNELHPDPSDLGGGDNIEAGTGIEITGDETKTISVDDTVAMKTDIPDVSDFITENEVDTKLEDYELKADAFSGSYDDLTDKPDLSVYAESADLGNCAYLDEDELSIAYSQITGTPTIPTKTSELTNDSGYITGVTWNDVTGKPTFSTVATSGDYDDLIDKPDLSIYAQSADLASVATTGSYNDLTDKPTIPSPADFVTTNTSQTIYGTKTFSGNKKLSFVQETATDKLGFTLYTVGLVDEKGYLEYNPTENGLYLGRYGTNSVAKLGFMSQTDGSRDKHRVIIPDSYNYGNTTDYIVTSVNNNKADAYGNVSLTIPTVNNNTITITQGGVTKGTFTLNQSTNQTIALDAGGGSSYTAGTGIDITSDVISVDTTTVAMKTDIPTVPTNVSAFTNDAGYITGITGTMVNNALGYTAANAANVPSTATSTSSSSSTSTVTPTTVTLTFTYSDNTTENITLMTGASVATTTTTTTTTTLS